MFEWMGIEMIVRWVGREVYEGMFEELRKRKLTSTF